MKRHKAGVTYNADDPFHSLSAESKANYALLIETQYRRGEMDEEDLQEEVNGGYLFHERRQEIIAQYESPTDKQVREKVEDMERRQASVTRDRVYTFVPTPNGIEDVVNWFKHNRPHYVEQSKQFRINLIYYDLKNAGVRPVDEMTVWISIDRGYNLLEITTSESDVEKFFETNVED
jgi:hypothetical protein